jgi:hypothetical protein
MVFLDLSAFQSILIIKSVNHLNMVFLDLSAFQSTRGIAKNADEAGRTCPEGGRY